MNGANAVTYGYDNDSLLTSVGALTLTRNAQNGFLSTTALGSVTSTQTYTLFGELDTFTSSLFSTDYTYDDIGRITDIAETVNGSSNTYHYVYDTAGRLQTATINALSATYTYDDNGNRLTKTGISGTATYDDQDRLLTYGDNTYTYNDNGDLESKTNANGIKFKYRVQNKNLSTGYKIKTKARIGEMMGFLKCVHEFWLKKFYILF